MSLLNFSVDFLLGMKQDIKLSLIDIYIQEISIIRWLDGLVQASVKTIMKPYFLEDLRTNKSLNSYCPYYPRGLIKLLHKLPFAAVTDIWTSGMSSFF